MIGIIFDLDGTLVDSSVGILDSLRHMLAMTGSENRSDEFLRSWIGPPLQTCAEHLTNATSQDEIQLAVNAYRMRYRERGVHLTQPFPGIPELLRELASDSSIRLAVATSKPTEFAQQIIDQHELGTLLPVVCGADWEGRLTKADLVADAARQISANIETSIMIGDRRFDIEGAHEHGLSAVGVSYGFGDQLELEEAGADVICDTVESLGIAVRNFLAATKQT